MWSRIDPANLDQSWSRAAADLIVGVTGGQLAAARDADDYLDEVLDEQGIDPAGNGEVIPGALAGIASDGRPLDSLLYSPITAVKAAVGVGAPIDEAMATGLASLDMIVRTQVADAGRVADQLATVARPAVTGYLRILVGDSCSRCVVLAGRRYRWNAGFQRHPACNCGQVPANEAIDDIVTNPRAYFDGLTEQQQNKAFTIAGAQAIRDGADVAQVVNARRGALGLSTAGGRLTAAELRILRGGRDRGRLQSANVFGQDLFVTTEGTTVRGRAGRSLGARETGVRRAGDRYRSARSPRLMPESIYQIADGDRDEALRLLRRNGYLTEPVARPTPTPPTPAAAPAPQPVAAVLPDQEPIAAPEPDVPVAAKGTDRLADEVALANADPAEVERLSAAMKQARHDVMLEQVGTRQGFDGLPRQAPRGDVDAAVSSGWVELWRGVVGKGTQTAEQINGRLRAGAYEPGRGVYGNGWYFSERRATAETFRGRDPKTNYPAGGGPDFEPSDFDGPTPTDSLIRVALDPGARIVDYDELKRMAWEWEAAQPRNTPAGRILSDPGRFAAALGYDAIRVGGQHGDGGMYPGWEDDDPDVTAVQYVVLNRTVMLIQRVEDVP